MTQSILDRLFSLQDLPYRDFQARLLPTLPKEKIIGVRTPALRALAKELCGTEAANAFLAALPHTYFDENQLHAFLIERITDYGDCIAAIEAFLPHIDNWATCDQLSPKCFARHKEALLPAIYRWMDSDHTYTIRFGIGMLLKHYLGDAFKAQHLRDVAAIRSDEYYVNMMIAWYFATALAFQWDETLPYLTAQQLDPWTHNKAIQKALESYRISPAQKAHLRTLKTT